MIAPTRSAHLREFRNFNVAGSHELSRGLASKNMGYNRGFNAQLLKIASNYKHYWAEKFPPSISGIVAEICRLGIR
jgi:hypothetical protein